MANYLLGIDNGGTVSKVVIYDLEGREIQFVSRKADAQYPRPYWVERSIDRVWQSTVEAIREALRQSGIDPKDILAIGNTGHGNGLYPVDHQGNPLRYGILSVDTRAEPIIERWKQTGIADSAWNYSMQQVWAGQTPALLRWMKENEPDAYARIGTAFLLKDYIKYKLTGVINADYSDSSCANLIDVRHPGYPNELFDLFGIPEMRAAMPELCESTAIIGYVTADAARETGLAEGTPVAGGIFDCAGSALGAGVIEPGQACIVAGTWSINEIVTAEPIDDRRLYMNSLHIPNRYLLIEASATSASNLTWFVTHFCAEEHEEAERRGVSVYDVCNEKVASLQNGTTVLFQPFLFGSNIGANARAGFYGVGGWHTKADLLRAVYEGIVYSHLNHFEKLHESGVEMTAVRLTGGGARSEVWTQMFADALQLPVDVPNGSEMGARGAAFCAGVGVGVYKDFADAVEKAVKIERRHEPNPEAAAYYRKRYDEYKFLLETLQTAWSRLNKLEQ